MKVSGPDPTRRSRGGRRHSGAPGGGVPARHAGSFTEVPDYEVAPIGAPLPHVGEGKKNEGAPRADQTAGAMTHARTHVSTKQRNSMPVISLLQTSDVELDHLQHRLGDTLGPRAVRI